MKNKKIWIFVKGWECLYCVGEIGQAVLDCIEFDIETCVSDIIGSGKLCFGKTNQTESWIKLNTKLIKN